MLLAVDIGSTDTKLGTFDREARRPAEVARISTADAAAGPGLADLVAGLADQDGGAGIARIVIGSVSPERTAAVRSTLGEVVRGAVVIELAGFEGLPFRVGSEGPPVGVGADRIANALASLEIFERDAIVVDAGTATTVDCIGADGTFAGGAIAPGLGAGAAWLGERAPHLPAVSLEAPSSAIGRTTRDALRSGQFHSGVAGIEGLVGAVREEWARPDVMVVATGGYASLLAANSPTFARVEPHLTLIGLAVAGAALSP